MNENKDFIKNKRIDHNVIKNYDDLLRDEYAQTLDAILESEENSPANSLIKKYNNDSIVNSSYTKSTNRYKNLNEEDLEKKTETEDAYDVTRKYIDRTQFPT